MYRNGAGHIPAGVAARPSFRYRLARMGR